MKQGKRSLLIVDDDPVIASSLTRLLGHAFSVQGAETFKAALALGGDPMLIGVFVDLGLPDGPGFRLLDLLRERNPLLRTAVLTGRRDLGTAHECFRRSALFMPKPISPKILLKVAGDWSASIDRVEHVVAEWAARHSLTPTEAQVLAAATANPDRATIAGELGSATNTVATHAKRICEKTLRPSLMHAAIAVLRETIERA